MTTGNSMTSRVRWTQPPVRCVPQSGQLSTTCSTRWVGVMRGRAKPWRRCFLGCCCAGGWRPDFALRPGIRGGPSGFARPSSSAIRRSNRSITRMLFQNGGLQLGNDGDEEIAVGGGQVTLSIHSLYMT